MMNKEQFLSVLQNKKAPRNAAEINGLKELMKAYPYMQNAWALYLKSLDIDKDEVFDATLKKTAIRTNDRSLLFDYINAKEEVKEESPELVKASNSNSEKQLDDVLELSSEQGKKEEQSSENFVNELLQNESAHDLSSSEETEELEETETTPIGIPGQNISYGEEKNTFNTREEKLEIVENKSVLEEILPAQEVTEIPSEISIEDAMQTTEEQVKDSVEEDIQTTDESHLIEDENQFNNELDNDDKDDDEDMNSKIRRLEVIISEMSFDEKEVSSEQVNNETSPSEIEADHAEEQDEESRQDFESKTEIDRTVSGGSDAQQKENTTDQTQEKQLNYFEWIKQSSKNSLDASNELETEEQERKYALLDAFLERNPKIVPSDEIKDIDIDAASSIEDNNLITETMAQLYMGQKQFKKAIEAYKTLILKYPEKSSFFAIQIQEAQRLVDQQKDTE